MTDGIISISTQSLIALHRDAQNIPLRSRLIQSRLAGNYLSAFKGRGMEFDEARLYQPGDDIRSIDWRLTARSGKPHTKLFREERERPVLLWVDYRRSMFFGTQQCYKSVMAAKTAALLAWSSEQHGDRLGGLIFSKHRHIELRPQRGQAATLHFIRQLAQHSALQHAEKPQTSDHAAEMRQALNRLRRVARPGSLIFLISDFRGAGMEHLSLFSQLARHNEVAMLFITDPLETRLPDSGVYRFSDGASEIALDTGHDNTRKQYSERYNRHRNQLIQISRKCAMRFVELSTAADPVKTLHKALGLNRD